MDADHTNHLSEQEFIRQYKAEQYVRPSVAADIVIFSVDNYDEKNYRKLPDKKLKLLLIQRGGHPYKGNWALPGGFVRPDETVGQAAKRELWEETGVENHYLEQLYLFSDLNRDPRTWVMSCAYMALINSHKVQLKAGDDAVKAQWFTVSLKLKKTEKEQLDEGYIKSVQYQLSLKEDKTELTAEVVKKVVHTPDESNSEYQILSNNGLAFDHAKIILAAMERLQKKISESDVALHLMPNFFTLTELQQVYEVILGKSLLKAAFRKKVAHMVVETDQYTKNKGHRPSKLYRRNWSDDNA